MANQPSIPYADLSFASIKERVAEQFASADQSVKVQFTEYFNNSFSPDLILSWPGESESRRVFLRTDSNPEYLAADVDLLESENALLLPLSSSKLLGNEEAQSEDLSHLQAHSSEKRVLVAPAESVVAFGAQREGAAYAGLISRAVFQGGSGLVREERAETIVEQITTGFEHASAVDPSDIEIAVNTAQSVLDTPRTNSITSFMQALWLASGGTSDSFPVPVAATPHIARENLKYLLEMDELDDQEFWRRISATVELDALLATGLIGSHINLQHLMEASANRFRARNCRLVAETPADLDLEEGDRRWFMLGDTLGLRIEGSVPVVFSNGSVGKYELPGRSADPSINDIIERGEAASVSIQSLSITNASSRVNYESADGSSINEHDKLTEIYDAMGEDASVAAATISVGSSQRMLTCNMESSTAYAKSNAVFYLSELALQAVPLMIDLPDDELEALRALFNDEEVEETSDQGDLAVEILSSELGELDSGDYA